MSSTRHDPTTNPVGNEVATVLRHNLVTPINLIVGYCDLMMGEAADLGQTSRLAPLREIRGFGFVLLNLIDRSLLADNPDRSLAEVQELGKALNDPAVVLIQACDTLNASIAIADTKSEFADDLQKIRSAGTQMIAMAESLASGQFPESDKLRTLRAD